MSFKDDIKSDLEVFVNAEEFAEEHDLNGTVVNCIIEGLTTKEQLTKIGRNAVEFEGISGITMVVHCLAVALPDIPVKGNVFTVDDNVYIVFECVNDAGMLTISLGVDSI